MLPWKQKNWKLGHKVGYCTAFTMEKSNILDLTKDIQGGQIYVCQS